MFHRYMHQVVLPFLVWFPGVLSSPCTCGRRRGGTDGSEVRYLQLAHNVWDPAAKRSRVQVVYDFGREEPATREALGRLVASVARHLEPGKARAIAAEGLEFAESGRWAGPGPWTRCGSGWASARRCGAAEGPPAGRLGRAGAVRADREPGARSLIEAGRRPLGQRGRAGHRAAGDDRRRLLPGDGLAAGDPRVPGEARSTPASEVLGLEIDLLFFDYPANLFGLALLRSPAA